LKVNCGLLVQIATSEEGFGIVTGFSTRRSYTEKSAVFAPMPTASVRIATSENPGDFHRPRMAAVTSDISERARRATDVPLKNRPISR
jgi:hypothetical protein